MAEKTLSTLSARGVFRVEVAARVFGYLAQSGHGRDVLPKMCVELADALIRAGEEFEKAEAARLDEVGADTETRRRGLPPGIAAALGESR